MAGLFAAVATILGFGLSRTDQAQEKRDERTKELALKAVEDSEKFTLAGEQKIVNENMTKELGEVRRTLNGVDAKLDTILLSGRLPFKKDES